MIFGGTPSSGHLQFSNGFQVVSGTGHLIHTDSKGHGQLLLSILARCRRCCSSCFQHLRTQTGIFFAQDPFDLRECVREKPLMLRQSSSEAHPKPVGLLRLTGQLQHDGPSAIRAGEAIGRFIEGLASAVRGQGQAHLAETHLGSQRITMDHWYSSNIH